MATELSRFLSEQLAGLPPDHHDRAFVEHINWLTERYTNGPKENPLNCLTPRKKEVLGLIAQGFSNGKIADRLVVGKKTVENYVNTIFSNIGVFGKDPEADARVKSVLIFQRNTSDFKNPFEGYFGDNEIAPLSPRQKEVISLIGEGYSNSAIAFKFNLPTKKAIENHIRTILRKKISVDHQVYNPRVVLALIAQTRHVA